MIRTWSNMVVLNTVLLVLMCFISSSFGKEEENDLATTCYPLDRALDVLVILDGSGSVGGGTFDIQIRMLRKVVDALEFGNDRAKLAVLQYSGYTKVEFNFNEYSTKEEIKDAIDKIRYISGTTRTGKALKKALETFSSSHGARVNRNDVAQVVVVVTDGHSQDDPVPNANALRSAGITVLAVGIGDYVNMPELLEIAVDPSHTFKNDSLDKFDETFRKIAVGEVCTFAKGPKGAEIVCGNDSIQVNVETRRPFTGHFYVKGRFNDANCSYHNKKSSGSKNLHLRFPLMGCGMEEQFIFEPRGLIFETTVILMFNSDYNTERDKAFTVRCFYPDMRFGGPNITEIRKLNENKDKHLQFRDDSRSPSDKLSSISSVISSFSVPQMRPPCAYVVRKSHGPGCISDGISVGEKLIHQWECDTGSVRQEYVMLVHSCFITDGQHQKRLVLDSDGCPIDSTAMTELVYLKPLLIQMETTAVKFADKPLLKFRCSIKFCNTRTSDCDAIVPPDCQDVAGNRTKRMAVPASAQALPQRVLDRLKQRQNSMLALSDDSERILQSNASKEIEDQTVIFPQVQAFEFTTVYSNETQNGTKSSGKSSKSVHIVMNKINGTQSSNESNAKIKSKKLSPTSSSNEATKRPSLKTDENPTKRPKSDDNSLESTRIPSDNSIESTKRPSFRTDDAPIESANRPQLKMDDNSLSRLWQAAIKNFTVRQESLNQNLSKNINENQNIPKVIHENQNLKNISSKLDINVNYENGTDIETNGHEFGPSRIEIEEMEEPKRFALSGLSNQIVASLKFDQIDIDSQMIMVHDIVDPDGGLSPVDYCPPDSRK